MTIKKKHTVNIMPIPSWSSFSFVPVANLAESMWFDKINASYDHTKSQIYTTVTSITQYIHNDIHNESQKYPRLLYHPQNIFYIPYKYTDTEMNALFCYLADAVIKSRKTLVFLAKPVIKPICIRILTAAEAMCRGRNSELWNSIGFRSIRIIITAKPLT